MNYKFKLWVKAQEDGFHDMDASAIATGSIGQHGFVFLRSLARSHGTNIYLATGSLESAAAWLSEEPRTAPFPAGSLLFFQIVED